MLRVGVFLCVCECVVFCLLWLRVLFVFDGVAFVFVFVGGCVCVRCLLK